MSLKRSTLEAMGLTAQQIETIMADHIETVDALKKERDGFKTRAEALTAKETELTTANAELEKLRKDGADAAKVQAAFDAFKQEVETEKENGKKNIAVRALFKKSGVTRDSLLELLMGKVDLSKVEMDGDNIKDADTFVKGYKDSYGDCFSEKGEEGTPKTDPPGGGNKTDYDAMSDEDFYKATYEASKKK